MLGLTRLRSGFGALILALLLVSPTACARDCSTGYVDSDTGRYVSAEECDDQTSDAWKIAAVFGGGFALWYFFGRDDRD